MDNEHTNPGVRYERKDIRLGWLLALMAAVVCVLAILGYGVWRLYWWQADVLGAAGRSPYRPAPSSAKKLPPEPRLEQIDRMEQGGASDVSRRLAAQEKALHSYGPSEEKGFVHVPIQQAIKAVAGKLPVRPPPGQAGHDNGLIDSGESNSGRMFRGGPR